MALPETRYATSNGLYVGSDTDFIGDHLYLHKKIAFFPLASGQPKADDTQQGLPGNVFLGGRFTGTTNDLRSRSFDAAFESWMVDPSITGDPDDLPPTDEDDLDDD